MIKLGFLLVSCFASLLLSCADDGVFVYSTKQKALLARRDSLRMNVESIADKMVRNEDEMEQKGFYHDPETPPDKEGNMVSAYIEYQMVQSGGSIYRIPELHYRVQYAGDSFLNINKLIFKNDSTVNNLDEHLTWKIDRKPWKMGVVETIDGVVTTQSQFDLLKEIAVSQSGKVRFLGINEYKEYEISDPERLAIGHMLDLFFAMGGEDPELKALKR